MLKTIAIDQGYTKTELALFDESGRVLFLQEVRDDYGNTYLRPKSDDRRSARIRAYEQRIAELIELIPSQYSARCTLLYDCNGGGISVSLIAKRLQTRGWTVDAWSHGNDTVSWFGLTDMNPPCLVINWGSYGNMAFIDRAGRPVQLPRPWWDILGYFEDFGAYELGVQIRHAHIEAVLTGDRRLDELVYGVLGARTEDLFSYWRHIEDHCAHSALMSLSMRAGEALQHPLVRRRTKRVAQAILTRARLLLDYAHQPTMVPIFVAGGVARHQPALISLIREAAAPTPVELLVGSPAVGIGLYRRKFPDVRLDYDASTTLNRQ